LKAGNPRFAAGWRLAQDSTELFLRASVFSIEPRFYYRYLDNANGVQEAFGRGGALIPTAIRITAGVPTSPF